MSGLLESIFEIESVFVIAPFDRHGVAFAEPTSQIDAPTALAAERKRDRFPRFEPLLTNGATNRRHRISARAIFGF